uniref:Uncharacterized protein n=1 Tax=Anguilla anguilla TaxID=7936 RepID=A0A0E9UWS9_ANGAN
MEIKIVQSHCIQQPYVSDSTKKIQSGTAVNLKDFP